MCEVICSSRGGNTWKLATAIADELNVKAKHIRSVKSLPDGADLLIGSGLYFLRPSKMVRAFIRNNDFQGRRVAIFGTSTTGIGIETLVMKRLLKRKGASIVGEYHCPGAFRFRLAGRFFFIRGKRPADTDLERAREFARTVASRLSNTKPTTASYQEEREDRVLTPV